MKLIYTETQTEAALGDAVMTRQGRIGRLIGAYAPTRSRPGRVHIRYDDTGYVGTYLPRTINAVWSK